MAAERGQNLGLCLKATGVLELESGEVPEPGDRDVLLKMDTVGICGSDVHYWTHGRIGDFVLKAPMILGHEGAGVVHRVGAKVSHLKPGDRVAIEPGYPCRTCDFCKVGRYNLCQEMTFCATPPVHGNLRQFYSHPADFCFKIPDSMTMEEAALMEPTSVAVHACRRANVELGKTVLVCGAGPIGLVNLITAKAMGASEVVVSDVDQKRLGVALSLGADATYQVEAAKGPKDAADEICRKFKDHRKPDVVIECSGAESSVATAILAARPGGVVVLVGLGAPEIKLPIVHAACNEIDIRGIFRYANCYPTAIAMAASGKVDLKSLVTHRFPLQEAVKAFETTKRGEGIKVVIKCNP